MGRGNECFVLLHIGSIVQKMYDYATRRAFENRQTVRWILSWRFALLLFRLFVYHSCMQERQDTIPIGNGTPNWKNKFPGSIAFIETVDTDEETSEPADILSFETLREAFATFQTAEKELIQTIPESGGLSGYQPEIPEQPEYEIDDEPADSGDDGTTLPHALEHRAAVAPRLETIIEAILFVGNRENQPIAADQIAEPLRNVTAEEVDQAVAHLNERYQERNSPYMIISEQSGYRLSLRSEFESVRANFYGKVRETRLSRQAIDTLAVVAYRQPITAEEIQTLRRQSCAAVLNQMVRRNLLHISRDVQNQKSVLRYSTTSRFLELFRIKSLADIPREDEWDDR